MQAQVGQADERLQGAGEEVVDIWDDMGDDELKTRLRQKLPHASETSVEIIVEHVRDDCETCQAHVREALG